MRKFKILFTLILSSIYISNVYSSSSIENIRILDDKTIEISASADVVFSDTKVYWDVKVLRDIEVIDSKIDEKNNNKLTLTLDSDLFTQTYYNLIWIVWIESSIDFYINEDSKIEIINKDWSFVDKIVLLNSRKLEIYYKAKLKDWIYEFKLLSDIQIDYLSSLWDNNFIINLKDKLTISSPYIFMILSLENIDGKDLVFNETFYNFSTNSNLLVKNDLYIQEEKNTIQIVDEWNLEELALNSAITPETWPNLFISLILTLIATIWFILFKYKQKMT